MFVLPNVIDINKYKQDIQAIVKEQAKLDLDFEQIKVITTPLLGAGVKIDNVKILLPDGSKLFSADGIKTRVSLPSLLLMTVKVSCLQIDNPVLNLDVAEDNSDYKVVKLVEDILNEQKEKSLGVEEIEETGFKFNPAWIRIKVPNVKLHNYKVLVTIDGKAVGAGETVTIKYNGKTYNVKTDKNGYATLKLNTKVKVKKYTITATYKGIKVTNKVTINHVIKASNKKVKKSKKVTKVKVSLKKVNGKYLKGKVLKIKFNKKTYKVKTNKKGVATWKVKKSMLKKLKVGKKYKYKVTYGKDIVTKKLTIKK